MKENVIITNCKMPGETCRILSMLRQDADSENPAISQAAAVKNA